MEEPLVYTSKGNLPAAQLDYYTAWHEDDDCIKFREVYTLKGTQEIVKESVHVKLKKTPAIFAEQGDTNG